ncbi:MAG: deoxyribodipyrimidine photo-lyase [Candidatus Aminicenantes bacterium]|nr:deoxyribodipyrimidine photo-lyase [Candidatus Aminicenantes bacterium]
MIQKERIRFLNAKDQKKGDYVLYWMQASQRTESNHALEYAVRRANEVRQPLVVFFGLTDRFPEANERHYAFMLEGLAEVEQELKKKGIRLVIQAVSPELGAVEMSRRASLAVVDRGYLKIQKAWRIQAAGEMECPLVQVESDAVVPVEEASSKEEYSAATIRKKIQGKLKDYLVSLKEHKSLKDSLSLEFETLDLQDRKKLLARLGIERDVKRTAFFIGGTAQARKWLQAFVKNKLDHFPDLRNIPTADYLSQMSPYLHFGQISPLSIALAVSGASSPGKESYLEELVVRRELSLNFVRYNERYDSFEGIPSWAQKTLKLHETDPRPAVYTREELEAAKTHDPYWNAAQLEMVLRGKMHGYMRMYWGKKIIEWSRAPEEAFATALYLNNKFELDGRDPNGYAGVAWCFGKHDRPWQERAIFGNVRTMNDRGLLRKFDADRYVKMIEELKIGLVADEMA